MSWLRDKLIMWHEDPLPDEDDPRNGPRMIFWTLILGVVFWGAVAAIIWVL